MDDNSECEHITISSKASSGKSEQIRSLHDQLLRESLTRQEIDELYEKLQSEYDTLLAKHAQAENTIDQLRIGARVNLFSDGPPLHQAEQFRVIEIKSNPQPISLPLKERAVINVPGRSVSIGTENNDRRDGFDPQNPQNSADSNLLHRLKDLQNDVIAFQSALADRELSYEEQRNLYNALKDKHDGLKDELQKMKDDNAVSQGANSSYRVPNNSFLDPNSLEGELYRLELRLAEVCDDIGDQLYSNRENDGALEQALKDDFQRLRLSSVASENARQRTLPGHQTSGNARNENEMKSRSGQQSRSTSDLSNQPPNGVSSKRRGGSSSNYDKKEALSPSNEDLAESGYYASESMTRESPKREISTNVPFRYLTRSRSPKEKDSGGRPIRRHWSLSEYNSQTESIDELTLHSSTDEEAHFGDGRKSRTDGQIGSEKPGKGNSHYQPSEANSTGRSSKRTSMHSVKESAPVAPVATSSPYEEKSVHETVAQNRDGLQTDEVSSQRRRSKKPTRASPSNRSNLENQSDGRRSSIKSGSRLSKTRPRQYNYSSSEESYTAARPERLNSSVYSEQDKVPSLVNLPKSNVHLSRHRPNTAESNLDSGFVGSEGTLKSQDFSNGTKYAFPKESRRGSIAKAGAINAEKARPSSVESASHPALRASTVEAAEVHPAERLRMSSKRDNSVDRLSEETKNSRARSREMKKPDSSENVRTPKTANKASNRLRETARGKSPLDDVISLQTSPETQTDASFRRLPVTIEKSPFISTVRARDAEDGQINAIVQSQGDYRYPRSTRSSPSVNTDTRRSSYRSKGDSHSRRSDPRMPRILSTHSEEIITGDDQSYDEDSVTERLIKQRPHRHERGSPSFNDSLYSSKGGRASHYTDRLRNDLQLLRDQLSQLNQMRMRDDILRHPKNSPGIILSPEINRTNRSYDDVKQKLDDLNDQLQKSLNQSNHRKHSEEGGNEPNRDYRELKDKIDYLTQELQRTRERSFGPKEALDPAQLAFSPRLSYLATRESQRNTIGQLPNTHDRREPRTNVTESREPQRIYDEQRRPHRTFAESHVPQATFFGMQDAQPTLLASRQSHPTFIAVCPICSGVGYHKHGDYVFHGEPVHVIQGNVARDDTQPIVVQASTPVKATNVFTSTPNRSVPNLNHVDASPMNVLPSTIHHIHTIHKERKTRVSSSSSESQSDDEAERRRRRGTANRHRCASRTRGRSPSRLLDEYDDWRLNDSLNEAAKAASNMQSASRRMLHNLASDLIKSGYSEY